MDKEKLWGLFLLLPPLLAVSAFLLPSPYPAAAALLLPVPLAALLPFCRGRESLWIFVMTAYTSLPANAFLLLWYDFWIDMLLNDTSFILMQLILFAECILVMSCVEQVLTGLLGRLLWPRQYKLKY